MGGETSQRGKPSPTARMPSHPPASPDAHPNRALVLGAFAAVYVIWGSTYLAIRYAVETLPPFLMTGVRFVIAGALLYGWARMRGAPRPTRAHWRSATLIGGLLLLIGTGVLGWAEQWIPSGIASLLVATVPMWIVLMEWARPGGVRPGMAVIAGVFLGLVGLGVLVAPQVFAGGADTNVMVAAVLLLSSIAWAAGSLYSRSAVVPDSAILGMGTAMLAGGALSVAAGLLIGEGAELDLGGVSVASAAALTYLVVFGALVGFTAYLWLLRVSTPARVATHAYVNPVVAVLLGWALAGEPLAARTLVAAAIIVGAVVLITTGQRAEKAVTDDTPAEPGRQADGDALRERRALGWRRRHTHRRPYGRAGST